MAFVHGLSAEGYPVRYHALAWLFLLGCTVHSPIDPDCAGTCLADPLPRCLRTSQCASDNDCPRGAECDYAQHHCIAVQERTADFRLLQTAFEIGSMSLDLEEVGGKSVAHWVAPNSTVELVTCTVYSCRPEVRADVVDQHREIANYEKCALLESGRYVTIARSKQGDFDLSGGRAPQAIRPPDEQCSGAIPSTRGLASDLLVGCLAYDATHLVAASPLRPVRPGTVTLPVPVDVDERPVVIPEDATCAHDFDPCYDAEQNRFGSCYEGACRRRCIDTPECRRPTIAGRELEIAKTSYCVQGPLSSDRIGVCVDYPLTFHD